MKKGFTLVELLIVIGILAILTAAVVIVLNPGELLRQARDSQRFSDFDALRSAIGLYLADATTTPSLTGASTNCYMYTGATATSSCGGRFAGLTNVSSSSRLTNGGGWIPINFDGISGGSPLTILPVDPSHGTAFYYAYAADNTALTFEVNAVLESAKYASKASADGGNSTLYYEVGNDPGLDK